MFFPFVFVMRMPIKNNSRYLFVFCFELSGREGEKNDVAICKCDDAKIESKFFSATTHLMEKIVVVLPIKFQLSANVFFSRQSLSSSSALNDKAYGSVWVVIHKKTIAHDCDLIWPHSLTFLKNSK